MFIELASNIAPDNLWRITPSHHDKHDNQPNAENG